MRQLCQGSGYLLQYRLRVATNSDEKDDYFWNVMVTITPAADGEQSATRSGIMAFGTYSAEDIWMARQSGSRWWPYDDIKKAYNEVKDVVTDVVDVVKDAVEDAYDWVNDKTQYNVSEYRRARSLININTEFEQKTDDVKKKALDEEIAKWKKQRESISHYDQGSISLVKQSVIERTRFDRELASYMNNNYELFELIVEKVAYEQIMANNKKLPPLDNVIDEVKRLLKGRQ